MTTKLKAFGLTLLVMLFIGLFIWSGKHYPEIVTWIIGGGMVFGIGWFIYLLMYELVSDED
jgi:hypothetical protein